MKLAAILLGLLSTAAAFDVLPRSLGQFALDRPAFVQLFKLGDPAADVRDQYTLFISNFNPVAILQVCLRYDFSNGCTDLITRLNWTKFRSLQLTTNVSTQYLGLSEIKFGFDI